MRKRLLIDMAGLGYLTVAIAIVQLALVPFYAKAWGLALYGHWLLLAAIPLFLSVTDLGFGTAAGNRLIHEDGAGQSDQALITFQSALTTSLGLGALTWLAVALVSRLLPDSVFNSSGGMPADEARLVLLLLVSQAIVSMQWQLFESVARAANRFALSATFYGTVMLAEASAVIAVLSHGGTPVAVATTLLSVRAIGVIAHMLAIRRLTPWLRLGTRHIQRERIRELVRPSLAAMASPVAQAVFLQGTAMAVAAASSAAVVPLYTALRTLIRSALQVSTILSRPVMATFTVARAQDNRQRMGRIAGALATIHLILAAIAVPAFALLGEPVMALWTHGRIAPPIDMIRVAAVALGFSLVWTPLAFLLVAINRQERYSIAYFGGALGAVALTYVLVGWMGVTGAAVAGLLLDAMMAIIVWRALRREVGAIPLGREPLLAIIPPRWRERWL